MFYQPGNKITFKEATQEEIKIDKVKYLKNRN
jgi:hypothetical protein